MKLSEAIRLGAMLKPQACEVLLSTNGRTCACGAALDAIGALTFDSEGADVRAEWPLVDLSITHPIALNARDVFTSITMLNDYHGWTREQIADWVETIEAQQDAPVALTAVSSEKASA